MFNTLNRPMAAYQQVSLDAAVQEADPHKLILMLFEGALAACRTAALAMQEGRIADKGMAISKAVSIIDNGLRASLDPVQGGQLAERLAALYEYMCSRLLWANLKNDQGALQEVQTLLDEIHDAWRQIDPKQTGASSSAAAT